jgi:hypothetical protein
VHGDRHLGLLQRGLVARGVEAGECVGQARDLGGVDVAQQRGVELHELLDELGVPRDDGLGRGVGPVDHLAQRWEPGDGLVGLLLDEHDRGDVVGEPRHGVAALRGALVDGVDHALQRARVDPAVRDELGGAVALAFHVDDERGDHALGGDEAGDQVALGGLGDLVEDADGAERDREDERYDDDDGELDPHAPVPWGRPCGPPAGGRPVVRCHVGLSTRTLGSEAARPGRRAP